MSKYLGVKEVKGTKTSPELLSFLHPRVAVGTMFQVWANR